MFCVDEVNASNFMVVTRLPVSTVRVFASRHEGARSMMVQQHEGAEATMIVTRLPGNTMRVFAVAMKAHAP